ncbi:MAG: hypothetical protein WBG70_17980 [Spirulinaceae cyanobacterium]
MLLHKNKPALGTQIDRVVFGAAKTVERISQLDQVLLIQDTTELDYSKHYKQGMGKLIGKGKKGLKVRSHIL